MNQGRGFSRSRVLVLVVQINFVVEHLHKLFSDSDIDVNIFLGKTKNMELIHILRAIAEAPYPAHNLTINGALRA